MRKHHHHLHLRFPATDEEFTYLLLTPARIACWGGQKRISKHVPRLGLCDCVPSLADAAAFALLGSSLRRCASDDGGGLLAGSMIRADRRVAMRCLVDSFAEPILLGSSPFLKLHFAGLSLSACSTFAPSRPASHRKAAGLGLCGGVEASSARGLAALEPDSTVACGFSAFGEGLLRCAGHTGHSPSAGPHHPNSSLADSCEVFLLGSSPFLKSHFGDLALAVDWNFSLRLIYTFGCRWSDGSHRRCRKFGCW